MSDERDPRIDPQPGDRIRRTLSNRAGTVTKSRRVVERSGGNVYYVLELWPATRHCAWITTWRTWAKDAEVLRG